MDDETRPPRTASVLAAWLAPAALAAIAFGMFFVMRNSADGIPWMSPAVFCGIPAAAFMAAALVLGLTLHGLLGIAGGGARKLRTIALYAAFSSFALFSLVGFQTIREYKVETVWKYLTALVCGAAAAAAAVALVKSRFAPAIAKASIGAGLLTIAAGSAAVWIVHHPASAAGEESDPRDFVSTFPPVEPVPERASDTGRVVVLGLDGVTWDKIDPLIAKKRLPNFEKLRQGGATARLKTIQPTESPAIWTTFATGVLPQEHRIQDFVVRRAAFLPSFDLNLVNRTMRRALTALELHHVVPVSSNLRFSKAIWNIATEMKIPSLTVGWWASYPAEKVNGWIVSEGIIQDWEKWFLTSNEATAKRSRGTTFPEDLAKWLVPMQRPLSSITREELGQFLAVDDGLWAEFKGYTKIDRNQPMSIFPSSYLRDEFFIDVTCKLDDAHHPEIIQCYTRLTDDVGHFFWEFSEAEDAKDLGLDPILVKRYKDVIDNSYVWADGVLGRFMARLQPNDTLIVVSDHGWERVAKGQYHHSNAPDGIVALYGAHVKPGAMKEPAHILDILPTLLYLAGIPKGGEMPGHALREGLTLTREEKSIPTWDTNRFGTLEAIEALNSSARMNLLEQVGYVGHGKAK